MKIACVGAGPGGLYFAISMKLRDPAHEVVVFERNVKVLRVPFSRATTSTARVRPNTVPLIMVNATAT